MDTLLNVKEGLDAWQGPEDASAEWIARWREGALLVLARIHDDHVVAGDSLDSNDAVGIGLAVLTRAPKGVGFNGNAWKEFPPPWEEALQLIDTSE